MDYLQRGLVATLAAISFSGVSAQMASSSSATNDWQNTNPCPAWVAREDGDMPAADKRWDLMLSPYTLHWSDSKDHKPVVLGSLDRAVQGNRFCGLSVFSNSFGQPTAYVYAGQRWDNWLGQPQLFAKVTAGIFYGYVGKYKDKVPLNYNGFSPGIIPSLGYAFSPQDSGQVLILGNAGLMFAYGHRF